jgi:hypothetical protein
MKPQGGAPGSTARTEKHSYRTRPRPHGGRQGLSRSNDLGQFSEKRVCRERRIGTWHRVAASKETIVFTSGKKSVQEKPVLTKREDDFSSPDIS